MKNNIYFLISSLLISLLFFLLLPLHSFAQDCPNNCSHNGVRGGLCFVSENQPSVCSCFMGFSGIDCSIFTCTPTCSDHGTCSSSLRRCSCDIGWSGDDCSINLIISCPNSCSGHGTCNSDSSCSCDIGWSGSDCSVATSPTSTPITSTTTSCENDCSGHGFCNETIMNVFGYSSCSCDSEWLGKDCSIPNLSHLCPNNCSGHGTCSIYTGSCFCNAGWTGSDCSFSKENFISMLQDVVNMSTVPDMTYVPTTYDCDDFASDLERELDGQGYNASFTTLWRDNGMIGHAVTDVHTTTGEIIFIEPQNGMIINLDENRDGRIDFISGRHGMASVPTEGMAHIEVYMDLNEAITAGVPID